MPDKNENMILNSIGNCALCPRRTNSKSTRSVHILGCDFNGASFDFSLYDYRLKSINKEYLLKWFSSHSKFTDTNLHMFHFPAHTAINTVFPKLVIQKFSNVNRKWLKSLVAWSNNVDRQMRALIQFCIIACYYGISFHYLPSAFCHSVEVIMIF